MLGGVEFESVTKAAMTSEHYRVLPTTQCNIPQQEKPPATGLSNIKSLFAVAV